MAERLYTPNEVADLLQVRPATVRRWIRDGELPAVKVGRKLYKIREDVVQSFLTEQETNTTRQTGRLEVVASIAQSAARLFRSSKGLDRYSETELKEARAGAELKEVGLIREMEDLAKQKQNLIDQAAAAGSSAMQKVLARRALAVKERIEDRERELSEASRNTRVFDALVRAKQRARSRGQESLLGRAPMEEILIWVEDQAAKTQVADERIDSLLSALSARGSVPTTREQLEDEGLEEIYAEIQARKDAGVIDDNIERVRRKITEMKDGEPS